MNSTSVSLLRRLREPNEEAAWRRFVELYAPLVFHWGKHQGLTATDAADLVQDVMALLVVKLPEFQYDPQRRFRGWLRTITVNKATDRHRRNKSQPQSGREESIQKISEQAAVDLFDEQEYRGYIVRRALTLMQAEFPDHYWRACWKLIIDGLSVAEVAHQLNLSLTTVRVAKCRVLKHLRDELSGLME